ncbi:hypothetical protein H7R52_05735 [Weissella confusa]|uniref:Uncharacterized protein n=1 Tax=Weissella confusa TaxID=1583 RepID=A0A923NGN8_WEICO|nr:hypothetical protein [Weissella confusa]
MLQEELIGVSGEEIAEISTMVGQFSPVGLGPVPPAKTPRNHAVLS